jgi:hypothetical protein
MPQPPARSLLFLFHLFSCASSEIVPKGTAMRCPNCNVIVFNFSSLHRDLLSQYDGSSPLLRIDAGPPVIFDNHFSTSNWPYQALASQHTGQDVEEHEVYNNWYHNDIHWKRFNLKTDGIDPKTPVLLELAKGNGMKTIFWGGRPHPSFYDGAAGFHRGAAVVADRCFNEQSDVPELSRELGSERFFAFVNISRQHFPHFILPGDWKNDSYPIPEDSFLPKTAEAFWVENAGGWRRINEVLERDPARLPKSLWEKKDRQRSVLWYLEAARVLDGDRGRENLLAHYRRALAYSEEMINAVIADLRRKDLLDRTLIVVTADTGDNLMTRYRDDEGQLWHDAITYLNPTPESYSVPLVFYFPARTGGARFTALTNHTDLIPTFRDVLGWDSAGHARGASVFSADVTRRMWLHSFSFRPDLGPSLVLHDARGTLILRPEARTKYYERATKRLLIPTANDAASAHLRNAAEAYLPLLEASELRELQRRVNR